MRSFLILLFLTLLMLPAYAIKNDPEGFRDVKWGDKVKKLKNSYCKNSFHNGKICTVKNDNMLFGQAKADSILYIFQNNHLCTVNLTFSGYQNSTLALKEIQSYKDCSLKDFSYKKNEFYQLTCQSSNIGFEFDKITQKTIISFGSQKYTMLR